jgi:hypothetical protein
VLLVLSVAYNIILPILLTVSLGVVFGRRFKYSPRVLSGAAFYVFVPALIVDGLAKSSLQSGEIGLIFSLQITLSVLLIFVGWFFARILGYDRRLGSAFMLTVLYINAGNYGLALAEFAFGPPGVQRALIFFIGTSVTGNTVGVFLASRSTATAWRSMLNMFLVPLPYATLLGLSLNFGYIILPLPVERTITLLGQAAVPVMLITLGIQLSKTSMVGRLKPILWATSIRLILGPIMAVPLVILAGLTGLSGQVFIVMAGMPTAVTTTILATEFGSDAEFTSAVVLSTTVASVITLSVLLTLIL